MPHNQFQALCHPGVIGSVVSHDFDSLLVFDRGPSQKTPAQSVTVYTAEISPGRWSFGFHVVSGDHNVSLLPGEFPGWFDSGSDARLYALEHIRISGFCPEEASLPIQEHIYSLRNPSLF